jgi:hypothetical protein
MTASDKPVALVVGASRGIGRQIAVDLALADDDGGSYAGEQSIDPPPLLALTCITS